jgi:6-pyruvoyltetrahydropterin/6-carboxytetrahydropterin synthase
VSEVEITKRLRIETAHRLAHSPSLRCRGVHGHSYVIEVTMTGVVNDETGMVVDFGEIKKKVGAFVDRFDHAIVLHSNDTLLYIVPLEKLNPRYIITPYHPTAEMMAAHIWWWTKTAFNDTARVVRVRVKETENSWAVCEQEVQVQFQLTVFSEATRME